ncbi:MAG TPA: hypothetical protein VIR03_02855 [Candidatus Saccharimonadales bacterium]
MTRLPIPGSDDNQWGSILNDYLSQAHNADGSLKANSVGSGQIQDGSLPKTKLDASTQASLGKADTSVQSVVGQTGTVTGAQIAADSSLRAAFERLSTPSAISPFAQGAAADYTGRNGTPGTGTDNRASIQQALNNASVVVDSSYYGYLSRKSVTVKLPPGHYLISAPSNGTPSLQIPAGVTFDFSDASLYFDYPSTATATWCAIKVGQYGQLIVGKLYNSGRVAAPDSANVYDAIRLWQTDNNSRIIGYKDSEISGFQGAGVRGVGAWISFVKGIRFTGLKYGYVASNYGDGTLGGSLSNPSGGGTNRAHTDLRISDCQFVNISNGGIVGVVQGNAGNINAADYSTSGLTLDIVHTVFENIGWYAMNIVNAFTVSLVGCAFEEVGKTGGGMVYIDTVRTFVHIGTRINLAGRSVPGPSGAVTPFPASFLEVANTGYVATSSMYVHNTYNAAMVFASAAAAYWKTEPIYYDGFDFAAGAMYNSKALSINGSYDKGLVMGSTHLWIDTGGYLRTKTGAPTSATDGSLISSVDRAIQHRTRTGTYVFPTGVSAGTVTLANGTCRYGPIDIADVVAFTRIGLEITTIGNAGSQVVLGIYNEDGNGYPTGSALASGTVAADGSTGWKEATISWTPPRQGRYIVAAVAVNAATTAPVIRSQSGFAPGVVCLATPPTNLTGYQDSATGLVALPASPSVSSNVGGPMIGLKVA